MSKRAADKLQLLSLDGLPANPLDHPLAHRIVGLRAKGKGQRAIADSLKLEHAYVRAVLKHYGML